ncbi:uncharacterized protein HD556DRAFT_1445781 [Suillus plorans]|uniref:Uncharacterized protein n=1 Tax=Suillus plorans TaxID=116603 RepID=A0A9P7AJQ8_9AGAM|nr:uncharacterized protein HD556DRAFT_1445781 [Suillus plorans]KAG1790763.1 hypothetical protein HD556DRAFT_1445781 [Suillus plorans]
MVKGQEEAEAHRIAFEELDSALPPEECNPNDSLVANPFEPKVTPITQAAVRLKLAEIEAYDLQQGIDISFYSNISPSIFVASDINFKDEQHYLKADITKLGMHVMDTQKVTI